MHGGLAASAKATRVETWGYVVVCITRRCGKLLGSVSRCFCICVLRFVLRNPCNGCNGHLERPQRRFLPGRMDFIIACNRSIWCAVLEPARMPANVLCMCFAGGLLGNVAGSMSGCRSCGLVSGHTGISMDLFSTSYEACVACLGVLPARFLLPNAVLL